MIQGPAARTLDLELGELAHTGEQAAAMATTVIVEHGVQPWKRRNVGAWGQALRRTCWMRQCRSRFVHGDCGKRESSDVLQAQKNRLRAGCLLEAPGADL